MKKLIIALLAMTLLLTAFVACGDNDDKTGSSTGNNTVDANKPDNNSSVQSLTSEEMDAWGDVSIGFESGDNTYGNETTSTGGDTSSNGTVTSDTASNGTESNSSTGNSATSTTNSATSSKNNNSVSSNPKDQGFGPWIPIP